jgi:hypothetical protein
MPPQPFAMARSIPARKSSPVPRHEERRVDVVRNLDQLRAAASGSAKGRRISS